MKYRKLGKTGISVNPIGLGCEVFEESDGKSTQPMLDVAEENNINYIDLFLASPVSRSSLGEALRGRREKFIIQGHLGTYWEGEQYKRTRNIDEVRNSFEDLLTRLETDYIDVGMIHYVDSLNDWQEVLDGGVMDYVQQLKKDGTIRHIGLSSHNPVAAQKAIDSGLIEVLMFSINPLYDLQPPSETVDDIWADESYVDPLHNMDSSRVQLYETCETMGVGITVMKAFGGGDLLDPAMSPVGNTLTMNQCIHYALTRPAVATVLSGARNVEELLANIEYFSATEEQKDYAPALAAMPTLSWKGHCMYCGHCAPCPTRIDVAALTKFLNLAKAHESVPETVREHYAVLESKASDCIECGDCEGRCPFEVPIIENMREAVQVFGE